MASVLTAGQARHEEGMMGGLNEDGSLECCPSCTSDLMVEEEDEWTDDQGETHTYLFCCFCEHEWEADNE